MERYRTLDGQSLELANLTPSERSYLDLCVSAYEHHVAWATFSQLVEGRENPLLDATAGRITPGVMNHPLYQTVRDLEDRLGVEQGCLTANAGDDPTLQPYTDHVHVSAKDGTAHGPLHRVAGH
jgi:hypothetical protein